jgi:hypothetical protein
VLGVVAVIVREMAEVLAAAVVVAVVAVVVLEVAEVVVATLGTPAWLRVSARLQWLP